MRQFASSRSRKKASSKSILPRSHMVRSDAAAGGVGTYALCSTTRNRRPRGSGPLQKLTDKWTEGGMRKPLFRRRRSFCASYAFDRTFANAFALWPLGGRKERGTKLSFISRLLYKLCKFIDCGHGQSKGFILQHNLNMKRHFEH